MSTLSHNTIVSFVACLAFLNSPSIYLPFLSSLSLLTSFSLSLPPLSLPSSLISPSFSLSLSPFLPPPSPLSLRLTQMKNARSTSSTTSPGLILVFHSMQHHFFTSCAASEIPTPTAMIAHPCPLQVWPDTSAYNIHYALSQNTVLQIVMMTNMFMNFT